MVVNSTKKQKKEVKKMNETQQENLDPTFEAQSSIILEDGLHKGTITEVTRTLTVSNKDGKKYDYTNIFILAEGLEDALNVGFPSKITPNTGLGQLALRFKPKIDFEGGEVINLKKLLEGKKIVFQTNTEEIIDTRGKPMKVSRIMGNTVKPA